MANETPFVQSCRSHIGEGSRAGLGFGDTNLKMPWKAQAPKGNPDMVKV